MLEHGDGWLGHVQLVTGRPANDIDKAAAAIEKAWDLVPGSVVVDSSAAAWNSGSTTVPPPPGTTGTVRWAFAITAGRAKMDCAMARLPTCRTGRTGTRTRGRRCAAVTLSTWNACCAVWPAWRLG